MPFLYAKEKGRKGLDSEIDMGRKMLVGNFGGSFVHPYILSSLILYPFHREYLAVTSLPCSIVIFPVGTAKVIE